MIAIPVNKLKTNVMRIKSVKNTRNRMRQTHRRAILTRPMTVTTDAGDVKTEELLMDTTGSYPAILLVKLQWIE